MYPRNIIISAKNILKETVLLKLNHQIQLLPNTERILFSSDILESLFGKYKNRVSDNPMASITSLILIIAAFTCNLTEESVKKSIENVKMADIEKWADKNIPLSLFQYFGKILLNLVFPQISQIHAEHNLRKSAKSAGDKKITGLLML